MNKYTVIRTRTLTSEQEINTAGGDIGVVVKLEDGRMAAGFAYHIENAILVAVKNAESV